MSNRRIEFFMDVFAGVGFGLTFGIHDKHLIGMGTFMCLNFYIEINLKKNR
jgi:hypothetical protein